MFYQGIHQRLCVYQHLGVVPKNWKFTFIFIVNAGIIVINSLENLKLRDNINNYATKPD